MHRPVSFWGLGLVCLAVLLAPGDAVAKGRMTTLCHVPPGNPENAQTITVGRPAVQTHLDQHACDYLGACNDYFPNGVASGDVDQSSVVLWARAESQGSITFEYGRDPEFSGIPDGIQTVAIDDPIVPAKVEFSGLIPGEQYHYRACRGDMCDDDCPFTMLLGSEERGKFRTPHASGHNGLRFGVSSCWRGDLKPFESIRNVPDRDLDFFVALGDTTYADSPLTGSRAQDLASYREKNECQYREQSCIPGETAIHDNIFAQVRASTASYVTIDDHEILNDFAGGTDPESHRERVECVDWGVCFCPEDDPNDNCDRRFINETDLFNCGMQAWDEYNPVREERYGQTGDSRTSRKRKLYRYRTFGKDAAIFMLDTRSFREAPVEIIPGLPYIAPPVLSHGRGRTMLGSAQLTDLLRDLKDAQNKGITWKFVLVPEPIQNLGWFAAPDRFESYARERGQILDFIQSFCIPNVVFVSGDIHATAANNLVYKKNYLAPLRYSETWDISTGAVAYGTPYAKALVEGLNLALDACEGDPICESLLPPNLPGEGFDLLTPEEQNLLAEGLLNVVLTIMGYPNVGLGADINYPLFLQKENAEIPATLLEGRYSAFATWGWTEFEIDEVSQKLSVTTYGIDPAGEADGEVPVVSKFEVDPRSRSGNDASCENDIDCASCRCSVLGECTARLNNGEVCLIDLQCKSDRCSFMGSLVPKCQPKLPNGAECLFDDDCLAGDCFPYSGLLDMRCWPIPDGAAHDPVNTCPSDEISPLPRESPQFLDGRPEPKRREQAPARVR